MVELICVACGQPLRRLSTDSIGCGECRRKYSVEASVIRFLEMSDAFYEGAYNNQVRFLPRSERLWHSWPLWLINSGYVWAVRRHIPAGGCVIELGCAAGVRYFGRRYEMVGCDLSFAGLARLDASYGTKLQLDVSGGLPFRGDSVDGVVSSYFWEHLDANAKTRLLAEVVRVLRPGGRMVFLYDVETQNPLIRHCRRLAPELYEREFMANDGHVGYATPEENLAVFQRAGLQIVEHRGVEKTPLLSPSAFMKFRGLEGWRGRVFRLASHLGTTRLLYPYTVLVRMVDWILGPMLPMDWARADLTVGLKPARIARRGV